MFLQFQTAPGPGGAPLEDSSVNGQKRLTLRVKAPGRTFHFLKIPSVGSHYVER